MAIKRNYQQYKDLFMEHQVLDDNSIKILKSVKLVEVIQKVIAYFSILFLVLLMLAIAFAKRNYGDGVGIIVFLMLVVAVVGSFFWAGLGGGKSIEIAKLDDMFFNKFLINNIKIFYSVDELKDFTYTKIKHITAKAVNSANSNQSIIELCFNALVEKAEGVIITGKNITGITSGEITKKGGNVRTHMVDSAEGILIKDIKQKNIYDSKLDIEYWYKLLQNGAITQDEYDAKKKELLLK